MGLVCFVFIFASPVALVAGLVMIFAHGICRSGLFCLITLVYERATTRRIIVSQGLLRATPILTIFFRVLLLTNLSAPPSLNLISEINMIYSILS